MTLRLEGTSLEALGRDWQYRITAVGNGATDARLAAELRRWFLRYDPDADGPIYDLKVSTDLRTTEEKGVRFIGKEYRLTVELILGGDTADTPPLGEVSGEIRKRMVRFNLSEDDEDDYFDAWESRFLEYAAGQIGEFLTP